MYFVDAKMPKTCAASMKCFKKHYLARGNNKLENIFRGVYNIQGLNDIRPKQILIIKIEERNKKST